MNRKKKDEKANSIPVHFADDEPQPQVEPDMPGIVAVDDALSSLDIDAVSMGEYAAEGERNIDQASMEESEAVNAEPAELSEENDDIGAVDSSSSEDDQTSTQSKKMAAGPMLAELIATRAELRRVETERNDLLERLARRQADFENYRKRVERERGETYQRMVGDVVSKLLPVMDNMRRALQAESMLEKNESPEFRHFLRGVELIYKQLNDALQELGVEPVPAVGQPFDPHVHEAVATEHSDEYEPDTVTQELLRGYRLGEKLLRPAMVKVSTRQ